MWMIVAAVAVAGTLGSLTDWVFMGMLFHGAYNRYPEVWRPSVQGGRSRNAIVFASVAGYGMTAAVVALCAMAHVRSIVGGLEVAAIAWLAGPPLVIVVNGLFIKIDPKITFAHCLGYLARMALAGAAAGAVLGPLAPK